MDPRPLVVTNEEYRFIIAEQLRQIGVRSPQIVLEPVGRNTAPALTLAALAAAEEGDPILLVMPADHVITDIAAFQHAIAVGAKAAAERRAGDLRHRPRPSPRPATATSAAASRWPRGEGARALLEFVEKPDRATAEALRRQRRVLLEQRHLHDEGLGVAGGDPPLRARRWPSACTAAVTGRTPRRRLHPPRHRRLRAQPERLHRLRGDGKLAEAPELGAGRGRCRCRRVGPTSGAWDALWAVSAKDGEGNAARGEVLFEACRNTLVHAGSRLVAAVGCEDMVVVETPDAVMVAHKDRTQDVKKVVARLKAEGRTLTQSHRKVYRPWGWYDSIDAGERFQVKRIVVNPGAKLSLQMHHHRAEHWIVVKGTAEVTNGERSFLLAENESTYIPLGHTHRLSNPGKVPLEIIEVQSGSYLGEDDIVRFEDTYGRGTN